MFKRGWWLLVLCMQAHGRELKFVGQEYPPFNSTSNGAYQGAFVELTQQICQRTRQVCSFESMPMARGLLEVRAGHVDGVLSLYYSDERADYLAFSEVVHATKLAFFGKAGSPVVAEEGALDGFTVAAVRRSQTLAMLQSLARKLPDMRVIDESDNVTLLKKLAAGRYGSKGAIFGNREVLERLAADWDVQIAPIYAAGQLPLRIGLSKTLEADIASAFVLELSRMKKSGELAKILRRFGISPIGP